MAAQQEVQDGNVMNWKDLLDAVKDTDLARIEDYRVHGIARRESPTMPITTSPKSGVAAGSSSKTMPSPTVDLASASAGFTQYVLDPSQSAADPQGASVQVFGGSSKIVAVPRGREWSLGLGPAPAAQSESAEERPATFSEFILEAANSPLGYGCRPDANDHSQATIHTTPSDRVTDRAKDPWDAFLMDIAVSEGERSPARSEELKRSAFDRVMKSLRYFLGARAAGMSKTDQTNVLWFRDHAGLTKAASRASHLPGPLAAAAAEDGVVTARESCWFLADPESCVAQWQLDVWEEAMHGGARATRQAWARMTLTNAFLHHILLSKVISTTFEGSLHKSLVLTARHSRQRLASYRSAVGLLELLEQAEAGWQAVARTAWMGTADGVNGELSLEQTSPAASTEHAEDHVDSTSAGHDDVEEAGWDSVDNRDSTMTRAQALEQLVSASIDVDEYAVAGDARSETRVVTSACIVEGRRIDLLGLSVPETAFLRANPSNAPQPHVAFTLEPASAATSAARKSDESIVILTAVPADPSCLWDAYFVGSGVSASADATERRARLSKVLDGIKGLLLTAKWTTIQAKNRQDSFTVVAEVEGVRLGKHAFDQTAVE